MSLGIAVHSVRFAPRGEVRTPHSVQHHRETPKSHRPRRKQLLAGFFLKHCHEDYFSVLSPGESLIHWLSTESVILEDSAGYTAAITD
jgi:hypothetical protein